MTLPELNKEIFLSFNYFLRNQANKRMACFIKPVLALVFSEKNFQFLLEIFSQPRNG